MIRRLNLLHRLGEGWSIALGSLVAIAALVVLLADPWKRPAIAGKELVLYCAAGMNKPVEEIIHNYREAYGVTVEATIDGSGKLLSKIRAGGGQGDLFLSADRSFMRDAQKLGLVAEVIPVAGIRPVVIVHGPTQTKLTNQGRPIASLKDLLRLRVFLANPEGAAIGRVGKSLLEKEGLWEELEKRRAEAGARVSTVGTVNEVALQVQTNQGAIGLAWDAIARQFPGVAIVPLPASSETREQVEIGVLRKSKHPTTALHFARYLTARDQGSSSFARFHFEPIADADVWEDVPHLHLFAGAMLEPGVRDVVKSFADREGARLDTSYAGCGILVSQMEGMQRGGESRHFPDVYIACDIFFADMVQPWFEPARIILENRLVMIVRKGNPENISSLEDLKRPGLKIGLPHPRKSAIGKLIEDLLVKLKFPEQVYDPQRNFKVTHTEAAHTLVNQIGSLDVAIVGRSNALATPANIEKYLNVIDIDHPDAVAVQTISIARQTKHKYLVERFRDALLSPESLQHFEKLGFTVRVK